MQQQQLAAQLAHSGGRHLNLRRSMSPGAGSTTGSESSISLGAPSPGPPSLPPLQLQSLPPPPLLTMDPPRIGLTNPSPCTLPQPLALHRPFTWYSPPHPPITAGWWSASSSLCSTASPSSTVGAARSFFVPTSSHRHATSTAYKTIRTRRRSRKTVFLKKFSPRENEKKKTTTRGTCLLYNCYYYKFTSISLCFLVFYTIQYV